MATRRDKSRYHRIRSGIVSASILGFLPLLALMRAGANASSAGGGAATVAAQLAVAPQGSTNAAASTDLGSTDSAATPTATPTTSPTSSTQQTSSTTIVHTRTSAS